MGIITKGMGAVFKKFKTKPKKFDPAGDIPVSYTHLRAPRDRTRSRMPSSA